MKTRHLFQTLMGVVMTTFFYGATQLEKPRPGKDFALFFAVENYQYWNKLSYPIDDAQSIARMLREDYDFETEVVPDPSLGDIFTTLNRYSEKLKNAGPDAQLLLFFTGHGYFDDVMKEGFFIPKEGKLNDLTQGTYLSFPRLQNMLRTNNCRHILLAIDACYSGSFDIALAMKGPPQWGRIQAGDLDERQQYIREELQLQSRLFLASGKLTPTPDQSEFASRFQKALLSKGGDDYVLSFGELWAELEKARPKPYRSEFEGNEAESNFLFVAKTALQAAPAGDAENMAWQAAQRQQTMEGYEYFLALYPNSPRYGSPAIQALGKLREQRAWDLARQQNTREAYDIFLSAYPDGEFAYEAREMLLRDSTPSNDFIPTMNTYLIPIEGGTFEMGDLFSEGHEDENIHQVTVSNFLLAKHELTFMEYDAFCEATKRDKPSDSGWGRDSRPVINVYWLDAIEYCNWRSKQEGLTSVYTIKEGNVSCNWMANGYRLPSEAEWEYAARQRGQKVRFGNGKDIADPKEINFDGNWDPKSYSIEGDDRKKTVPVGSLNSPNTIGLLDMSGNVWEWCWDWYGTYPLGLSFNPKGPDSGSSRVVRGGAWKETPDYLRTSFRGKMQPDLNPVHRIGFRLARTF